MAKRRVSRKPAGVPAVAIVVSRYNASVTDRLLDGARAEYSARGGTARDLHVVNAPGSFELPALAFAAALTLPVEGVLALGCIIKGETAHDRVLADAVASGLVGVTLHTGVPVSLGVLTTNTSRQAMERAGGRQGNKGQEAMGALLDTIDSIRGLGEESGGGPTKRPDKAARRRR
ncbi:6,7-dimethyl-8-ribityllumazine synthase [Phycisphaerales bacterium]|nr:6,7-dimethyl-8-ribityllumazine synthase [Phycisphaerales bacterium]